eukprot:765606-Hanusia_phi.AAC.2
MEVKRSAPSHQGESQAATGLFRMRLKQGVRWDRVSTASSEDKLRSHLSTEPNRTSETRSGYK